jgi:hypothetical protein
VTRLAAASFLARRSNLRSLTPAGLPFASHRRISPDGCREGGTTVCNPVERTSRRLLLSISANFSDFMANFKRYHQCDICVLFRPWTRSVGGRKYGAKRIASMQSRSTSVRFLLGFPSKTPTLLSSSRKSSNSFSEIRKSCHRFSRGAFSRDGIGMTHQPRCTYRRAVPITVALLFIFFSS